MATYHVRAAAGEDFQTIAQVNAFAFSPGDFVLFNRGETWTGTSLNITRSGSEGNLITFGAYGTGAKPIIDVDNCDGLGPIYSITAGLHDIAIENIEPRNSSVGDCCIAFIVLPAGTGVMNRIYIDSIDITDCAGKPIFIKNIDTFEITNCDITSGTLGGIVVFGTAANPACNGTISYNHIDGRGEASNDGIGIHENDGDLADVGDNFLVSHNVVHGYAEQAIDINSGNYVTVSDNECYDNGDDGIIATGFNQVFSGNECYGNGRYGIVINCTEANPGGELVVHGNNCHDNDSTDILLVNVAGYSVYDNIGVVSIQGGTETAASTYYVDTASSGGDGTTDATTGAQAAFATVAAAQGASLSAGDSILFKCGCTWSNSTFTCPTQGATGNNITLGAYGTGAKPIIQGAVNNPAITVTAANRGYWTVDGLDLRGTGNVAVGESLAIYFNYWAGVDMGAVPGWTIQNCDFTAGIWASGPNLIVQDNTFDGTGNATAILGAITVRGENTAGDIIRRNTISNWTDRGIWPFSPTGTTCPGVTVNDNIIHDIAAGSSQDGVGINFDGAANYITGGICYGNTIYDCAAYGISHENCVNQQTYKNLIHDVNYGMTFMHYDDYRGYDMNGVVSYNVIYNVNIGLLLIYGGYWSFLNNAVYGDVGADTSGFKVLTNTTYTSNVVFTNNIIAGGFDYPLNVPDNAAIWTQLDYNCIIPSGTRVMLQIVGGSKTLADLQAMGYMTNGTTSDPMFVSPTGTPPDFHTQTGSPCIDAGVGVGLTTDYDGNPIH